MLRVSRLQPQFGKSSTPSFCSFPLTHHSIGENGAQFVAKRIVALSIERKDRLADVFAQFQQALFLPLFTVLRVPLNNQCAFFGKMIRELAG